MNVIRQKIDFYNQMITNFLWIEKKIIFSLHKLKEEMSTYKADNEWEKCISFQPLLYNLNTAKLNRICRLFRNHKFNCFLPSYN